MISVQGPEAAAPAPPAALRLRLELELPSDVRYIEPIVGLVQHECRLFAFPASHCTLNVPVALSEAISNAILRGNEADPSRTVRVRVHASQAEMVLEVEDEGEGFDLEALTHDPADPANIEREDGRGLFLMHALMDRVERFDRPASEEDGRGGRRHNVVRLTLRRRATRPGMMAGARG